jgi:nitrogen fixation NifU-like protein
MQAPDVTLEGTSGPRPLRPIAGPHLLLIVYEEDGTPTCTTQLCSFREDFDLLAALGVEVAGMSTDSLASHIAFLERLGGLPFPLLSDPQGAVARSLGAWDASSGRARRALFVIAADGEVVHAACPYSPGDLSEYERVFQVHPICGDTMKLMLRIADGRVADARWQTVGCEPARAASSIATELAMGRPLDEVAALTKDDILAAAGGLPASKVHASTMAAEALRRAVASYRARHPE